MKLRFVAAAVLSVSVMAAVAGCSSSGLGSDAHSSATPTPTVLTTASFSSAVGDAITSAQSAHVSLKLTTSGQKVTADGDVSYGDSQSGIMMELAMSLPTMSNVDMRFVGGTIYINLGTVTQNKFVAIDPNDSSSAVSKSFAGIANGANPGKAFDAIKPAVTSVTVAGPPVTLDGVETTPYAVSLTTSGLVSALGLPSSATSTLPPEVDYTYWIGPDNLIRKETFTLSGSDEELDYSKWGEPVAVTAPTPDQITKIAGL